MNDGMTLIEAPKSNMALATLQSPMVHGIEKILRSRHFFGMACCIKAATFSLLINVNMIPPISTPPFIFFLLCMHNSSRNFACFKICLIASRRGMLISTLRNIFSNSSSVLDFLPGTVRVGKGNGTALAYCYMSELTFSSDSALTGISSTLPSKVNHSVAEPVIVAVVRTMYSCKVSPKCCLIPQISFRMVMVLEAGKNFSKNIHFVSLQGQPRSNLSRTHVFMMLSMGIIRLCRKRKCRMQTRTIMGMQRQGDWATWHLGTESTIGIRVGMERNSSGQDDFDLGWDGLGLQFQPKAPKGLASKAFKVEESCGNTSYEDCSDEDELSFISRKIQSIWKHKRGIRWKNNFGKHTKETKDKMHVVCYEYKKLRHFKSKCPNLEKEEEKEKKKPFIKKKKSLMNTWEDLNLSSSKDEDEEANLCLMADTTSKMKMMKSILKKENEKLKEEQTNDLSKVNISKVTELQKEVIDLRQSLAKFVNSTKTLNKLLKYSRSPHDKFGLGFEKEKEIKEKSNIHYSNYRKFGCRSYDYRECSKGSFKPSRTSPKGPKKIWVPKIMIILVANVFNSRKKIVVMKGGWVNFRNNHKGKIVGIGQISKHPFPSIDNVLYVKGLKHNPLSISQLCDSGYDVSFNKYIVQDYEACLISINDDQWMWYKTLGHASLRLISKLSKHNLMRGLPSLVYKDDLLCDRKEIKGSFESKSVVSTSRTLKLLHIDLFGPTKTASLGGKHYRLVVVDEYSRWTWIMFLPTRMGLLRSSIYSANIFRMKKVLILPLLEVII
ncbi:hypothetical protein CR513_23381, partial [Mucuna pruriens]